MAIHYQMTRLLKHGHPPMVVIRRELNTGSAVLPVGAPYPVNWDNKAEVLRMRQYYDQRRIDVSPDWLVNKIPGAARYVPEASTASELQPVSGVVSRKKGKHG